MKFKSNQYSLFSLIFVLLVCVWFYQYHYYSQLSTVRLSPKELAVNRLNISALSSQSIWDQEFLEGNPIIKEKILKFEKGELCKNLKALDNKLMTHQEILAYLKGRGFKCIVRPISRNSSALPLTYLKTDNTITQDPKEEGVAHQEICQDQVQNECVIRIKRDGFPLNKRSAPHSSKAVLIDEKGDPGAYDNEAFKITAQGQPVPKGPSRKMGLKKCPDYKDKDSCLQWIDALMEEAHPLLKEPRRKSQLNSGR